MNISTGPDKGTFAPLNIVAMGSESLTKRTILIAEDDPDDRFLYENVIAGLDCIDELEIEFATDGADLMRRLKLRTEPPAMLFLDLNLPYLTGRECLQLLRIKHGVKDLPVYILSTSSHETDIGETYRLGANMYIEKPLSYEAIQEAFAQCICEKKCSTQQAPRSEYFRRAR